VKNQKSIVMKFAILQILLLASIFTYAQADWERKQDKANQDKRDNFQMQVDLDKRNPNKGSKVGSVASDNYSWGDNRSVKRQEAGEAKQKAIVSAFDAKIDQMEKCIKQKNLTKRKENYDAIIQCATDAGIEYYNACRMFGFNATEYQARQDRIANEKKEEDRQKSDAAAQAREVQIQIQNKINAEDALLQKKVDNARKDRQAKGREKAIERNAEFPIGVKPIYLMELPNGNEYFVWELSDKTQHILYKFLNGDIYEASLDEMIKLTGKITRINGDVYNGRINNDIDFKAEGEGKLVFGNNSGYYTGNFKNNRLYGAGRIQRTSGNYLIGDFINNDELRNYKYYNAQNETITFNEYLGIPKSGFAKVDYNDCTYEGNWKKSKQNGQGTKTWSKINRYVGEFDDNKMSGTGTYYLTNGCIYTGDFKDDSFNGQGTMKYTDDYIYTGKWKDDSRDGNGILTRKDGFYIKANFKGKDYTSEKYYNNKDEKITLEEYNGKQKSGYGKLDFSGDSYEGNIENGKPNGKGTYTLISGAIYEGDFVDGMFEGTGTKKWKNGRIYIGDFKKDKMEGKGTFKYPTGAFYIGEFKNDMFNGYGIYSWEDGATYKGEFKNDKFNGKGIITKLSGYYKKGDYKNDEGSNLKYYNPSGKEIMEEEYDKN
jgi:hypothetical protein